MMEVKDALTLVLGAGVALVGYSQWRTANQRVVMDLVDKRLAIYRVLHKVIVEVVIKGRVTRDDLDTFYYSKLDARFLFGDDVAEFLTRQFINIKTVGHSDPEVIKNFNEDDRQSSTRARFDALQALSSAQDEGIEVFAPYMRVEQRSTPFWRPW